MLFTKRVVFHLAYKSERNGVKTMCGAERTKWDRSIKSSRRFRDVVVKGGTIRFMPCSACMREMQDGEVYETNSKRMLWG